MACKRHYYSFCDVDYFVNMYKQPTHSASHEIVFCLHGTSKRLTINKIVFRPRHPKQASADALPVGSPIKLDALFPQRPLSLTLLPIWYSLCSATSSMKNVSIVIINVSQTDAHYIIDISMLLPVELCLLLLVSRWSPFLPFRIAYLRGLQRIALLLCWTISANIQVCIILLHSPEISLNAIGSEFCGTQIIVRLRPPLLHILSILFEEQKMTICIRQLILLMITNSTQLRKMAVHGNHLIISYSNGHTKRVTKLWSNRSRQSN